MKVGSWNISKNHNNSVWSETAVIHEDPIVLFIFGSDASNKNIFLNLI